MHLAIVNGSPRGGRGNTALLLEEFTHGFTSVQGNTFDRADLITPGGMQSSGRMFAEAETILLAFPLYCDCMPSCVKAFIESLAVYRGRAGDKAMGFLVHSGFMEAVQSRAVERYLEKLAQRLGARYLGTVIKGGTEGTRQMPPEKTRKLRSAMQELGKAFGATGEFDARIVKTLAGPEKLPGVVRLLIRPMAWLGLLNGYWDAELKRNGAFERRFARPYEEK